MSPAIPLHLVTGFPDPVARGLAGLVVQRDPTARAIALVSSNLESLARTCFSGIEGRDRIDLLIGDCTSMDFGLSGAEVRSLTERISHMHLVSHADDASLDRRALERRNVGAAWEALQLARSCRGLVSIVFHSTAFVAGLRTGTVYERELDEGQAFQSAVEETRARAEAIMRKAQQELPIVIVRPSFVVAAPPPDAALGSPLQGFPQILPLFAVLLRGDVDPRVAGRDARAHVVPSDFVVEAAYALANEPRAIASTFHLVDPHPPDMLTFARALRSRALDLGVVESLGGLRALLRGPVIESLVRSPKTLFDPLSARARFDAHAAATLLEPLDIRCPSFDSYVERLAQGLATSPVREPAASAHAETPLV